MLTDIQRIITARNQVTVEVDTTWFSRGQSGINEANIAPHVELRRQSRRQLVAGTDLRRALTEARRSWYPIMVDLCRFMFFMFCVSRVAGNDDGSGGTALVCTVWYQSAHGKARRRVRVVVGDAAMLGVLGSFLQYKVRVVFGIVLG